MSKYKQSIYELINQSTSHMTADEVYKSLKQKMPDVVLATVYNNLNSLVNDGLIKRVLVEGQVERYDKIRKHDHLVCKKCGRLIDFNFSDLTNVITSESHCRILGYDLKAFIICDDCAKEGDI